MNQNTFTLEQKNYWIKIGLEHQKADRFRQNIWYDKETEKGCFFGCFEKESSSDCLISAPNNMNIPEWLVRVSEKIFEGLPQKDSLTFPVELLKAIPPDSDLTDKWKQWNYRLLMDKDKGQIVYCNNNKRCIDAVTQVSNLFLKDVISESEAWSAALSARSVSRIAWSAQSAARSAAWSAARIAAEVAESAARSVARSAAWSAARIAAEVAESAARSVAESAAWSARSAAESAAKSARSEAWSEAWSVARSEHYLWMKNTLINILSK